MTYERFEQLPVRQAAIGLATAGYTMTEKLPFRPDAQIPLAGQALRT